MQKMSRLLEKYLSDTIKIIVDKPEKLKLITSVTTKAIILQIKVEQSDCGKIIGRHGRNIDALKTICLAIKNTTFPEDSRKVILEVLEDENSSFSYNN